MTYKDDIQEILTKQKELEVKIRKLNQKFQYRVKGINSKFDPRINELENYVNNLVARVRNLERRI